MACHHALCFSVLSLLESGCRWHAYQLVDDDKLGGPGGNTVCDRIKIILTVWNDGSKCKISSLTGEMWRGEMLVAKCFMRKRP